VAAPYQDRAAPFPAQQPNAIDIAAVVDKVKDAFGASSKARAQLQPAVVNPNTAVTAQDIGYAVSAVKGSPYTLSGPTACP
jgi:hypothetical protein